MEEIIENDAKLFRYFPKYGDYFGSVMMMGLENLGMEHANFDKDDWDYGRKIHHAAKTYYWLYDISLEDSLNKVELDDNVNNRREVMNDIKRFFEEDSYIHFIIKGRDKFQYCEQRLIRESCNLKSSDNIEVKKDSVKISFPNLLKNREKFEFPENTDMVEPFSFKCFKWW